MNKSQSKAPCFLCGSNSFSWGHARNHGGQKIQFSSDGQFWFNYFVGCGNETRARRCDNCGNILLSTNRSLMKIRNMACHI